MASQIVENVDKKNHCLSNLGKIRWRLWGEKQGSCVKEKIEEGCGESSEDIVNFGKKGIGTSFCAPGTEDGMCGLEDSDVDFEIRVGEGDCQFLSNGVSYEQCNTSEFEEVDPQKPALVRLHSHT